MINKYSKYTLPVVVAGLFVMVDAAQGDDVNLMVSGSISTKTCVINGGKDITIDFGSIPVAEISDSKYQVYTEVPVECDFHTGTPYVKIIGTPLGSDGNVVATNIANFGIALYQQDRLDKPLKLGEGKESGGDYYGYRISWGLVGVGEQTGVLSFTAAPYVLNGNTPDAGQFSATATLSFSYL